MTLPINNMEPNTGRLKKENDEVINIADLYSESTMLDPNNEMVIRTVDIAPFGIASEWETRKIAFSDTNVKEIELPNNTITLFVLLEDGLSTEYYTICNTGTEGQSPDSNSIKIAGNVIIELKNLNFIGKSIYFSTDGSNIQLIILKTGE